MEKRKAEISAEYAGMTLRDALADKGIYLPSPCGGKGKCGKCLVELPDGKKVPACKTLCPREGITLLIPEEKGEGIGLSENESAEKSGSVGIALDIGTTTLAASLVEEKSGNIIRSLSRLNPESAFGADVMSRITASSEGHLQDMQRLLASSVTEMIQTLSDGYEPHTLYVAGNPTMLHIFAGISPEGMGKAPFIPAFTETKIYQGAELRLPISKVVLLPSSSAFIGSDITGGVFSSDMLKTPYSMLVDIGTNGEMVLYDGGKLFSCSTAAGPALEGAGISCGIGGVEGAVNKVYEKDGKIHYRTVGNMPPIGICGSGLVDLIAVLLDKEIIDDSGFMEEPYTLSGIRENESQTEVIEETTALTLTQRDVRAFQLAKSAICSGFQVLLKEAGINAKNLSRVYVAGTLGYYLNMNSCVRVGMFPGEVEDLLTPIGNSAALGAALCVKNPENLSAIESVASRCINVDLNKTSAFSNAFVENMAFPWE